MPKTFAWFEGRKRPPSEYEELTVFVPAVERFFELSRANSDSYAGNYKKE